MNLQRLTKLYRDERVRPLIAKFFLTGQYHREIIRTKKRCPINKDKPTNSARNLLRGQIFDAMTFIQGSVDNRVSLTKPITEFSLLSNKST